MYLYGQLILFIIHPIKWRVKDGSFRETRFIDFTKFVNGSQDGLLVRQAGTDRLGNVNTQGRTED